MIEVSDIKFVYVSELQVKADCPLYTTGQVIIVLADYQKWCVFF